MVRKGIEFFYTRNYLDMHAELALILRPGNVKRDNILIDSDQDPAKHIDNALPLGQGPYQILEEGRPRRGVLKLQKG